MAEGAPLLREYRVYSLIEGSNPSLSARYAKRPLWGVLRIWRRDGGGRTNGSTNSSGTNLDSRRLAPQRAARRGEAQDGPSNPHDSTPPRADPKRRFAYLAERRWWTNQRLLGTSCASHSGPSAAPMFAPASCLHRRQIRLERIWTAAGWPRSAQREGVRPRMARAIPLTPRRLVLDRRAFCVSGGAD